MNETSHAAERFKRAMNLLRGLEEIQCSHPRFNQFRTQINYEICLYGDVIHPQAIDLFQKVRTLLADYNYVESAEEFRDILPRLIRKCREGQRLGKQLREQYKVVIVRLKRMERQTTAAENNATQEAEQSDKRDTAKKVGGVVSGVGGVCSGIGAVAAVGVEVAVFGATLPVSLPLGVVFVAGVVVSATCFKSATADAKHAEQSKGLAKALNGVLDGFQLISEVVTAVSQVLNSMCTELNDITFREENNSSMTQREVEMYVRRTRSVAQKVIPGIDSVLSDNVDFEAWLGLFSDIEVEPTFKAEWFKQVHPLRIEYVRDVS